MSRYERALRLGLQRLLRDFGFFRGVPSGRDTARARVALRRFHERLRGVPFCVVHEALRSAHDESRGVET